MMKLPDRLFDTIVVSLALVVIVAFIATCALVLQ